MRAANIALAVAFAAAFLYWDLRERLAGLVDAVRSGHPPATRRALRLVLPAIVLVLILQLLHVVRLPPPLPESLAFGLAVMGHVLAWSGLAVAVWAREALGRHWAHAADYQVLQGQALVTRGPYRTVRHPIYAGLLAAFVGGELAAASWFVAAAVPLFILIRWQADREEILLREVFGEAYERYANMTGKFFPKLRRR